MDEWVLGINTALVREFVEASAPDTYVVCRLKVIEKWAGQSEKATIRTQEEPATAFVVMPFVEPWSDQVYAYIGRAVDALDGRLIATRADEIAKPGRITDQIIDAIGAADVVIADITGRNPNVFWELGFAHAVGRPCALLMQRGDSAPFDIYDHRRVDYETPPTAEDERRLTGLLRSTLG